MDTNESTTTYPSRGLWDPIGPLATILPPLDAEDQAFIDFLLNGGPLPAPKGA